LKKELKIFIFIFVVLTVVVHYKEFLAYPIKHILSLPNSGAYGFGISHPLVFTALGYVLFLFFRILLKLIRRII
jgi:hypothetical protein